MAHVGCLFRQTIRKSRPYVGSPFYAFISETMLRLSERSVPPLPKQVQNPKKSLFLWVDVGFHIRYRASESIVGKESPNLTASHASFKKTCWPEHT